ncbi:MULTISPECIES: prealbumin-like fold domain-containing protein [Streptococcus]|uniref:SpaA-like prealbumin fold domain-containing protein n=1 Tax=Streptococcus suis TaxID=1307 RepID=A0A4T2GZ94_STRSU|nr:MULTISPECIES: prealbumin-like fold domain-containing protein [Streptococcus]MBM0194510.1 prealbumin-like fold domain-containing protein [Streptococcus suis]MBM7267264.1 prealbumin-like fold domain-containing protein [Streptococcus suis]MBM7312128.1 prealbumin-like fold domain-containing protein [Streptococcus suis]MBM7316051.1 prealbumin-like fold domain-containing protein [Streptococcus suis]MBO3837564.1 prealbumin-like fold domain-containing protein [Streptococcus suis]
MKTVRQIICCLVAIMCVLSLPSLSLQAQDSFDVQVHIPLPNGIDASQVSTGLEAWYIASEEPVSSEQLADSLYQKSRSELTSLYGEPISSQALSPEGQATFRGLTKGWYYVRQVGKPTSLEVIPFLMNVGRGVTKIEAKVRRPSEEKGSKPFLKVSTSTAPLSGAEFAVLEEVGGELKEVIVDGNSYHVTSSSNGQFVVGPLPYGTYYLKEVKAPTGYILSQDTIPFEITSDSHVSEIIKIKNKPVTPPGIEIPYTGNVVVIAVLSTGILLFLLGYRLVTYTKR